MAIIYPRLSIMASRFSWRAGHATAEASCLDLTPSMTSPGGIGLGRCHDDSCDVGFTMVSDRTSKRLVFRLEKVVKDKEGDILSWEFRCIVPGFRPLQATIFND